MLLLVQIAGIIFGMGMIYLTYLHLRRKEFGAADAAFWSIVWLGFIVLIVFSGSANIILEKLNIHRAMDLIMMLGFVVIAIVMFHLYTMSCRLNKKIETLVRKIAIRRAGNPETSFKKN